jgi:hypothetical protein
MGRPVIMKNRRGVTPALAVKEHKCWFRFFDVKSECVGDNNRVPSFKCQPAAAISRAV